MTLSKKIITLLVLLILFLISGYLYQKYNNNEEGLIGGQKDNHECLIGAGYSWCEAKNKCIRIFEEGCDDEIFKLAELIKSNIGINFIDQGEKNFNWLVLDENQNIKEKQIQGRSLKVEGISFDKLNQLEQLLKENGEEDMINVADGPSAGLRGYLYHYMACNIQFEQNNNFDVYLNCGFYNKNIN
jgi:hypothetical protein